MQAAWEAGVNFFDNAEVYAGGKSETITGQAVQELGWPRESFVISTKLYRGLREGPNTKNTLNRKYMMHGIDGSLNVWAWTSSIFCFVTGPTRTRRSRKRSGR